MRTQEVVWQPVCLLGLALLFRCADSGPPVVPLVASGFSLISVSCTEVLF